MKTLISLALVVGGFISPLAPQTQSVHFGAHLSKARLERIEHALEVQRAILALPPQSRAEAFIHS